MVRTTATVIVLSIVPASVRAGPGTVGESASRRVNSPRGAGLPRRCPKPGSRNATGIGQSDDREATAGIIEQVQRQRRQRETDAPTPGQEEVKVSIEPDDRAGPQRGHAGSPGNSTARSRGTARISPVIATQICWTGLTFRSVSMVPLRLIRSIQGTPRRKMSVRTISKSDHRFKCVASTSRASRCGGLRA